MTMARTRNSNRATAARKAKRISREQPLNRNSYLSLRRRPRRSSLILTAQRSASRSSSKMTRAITKHGVEPLSPLNPGSRESSIYVELHINRRNGLPHPPPRAEQHLLQAHGRALSSQRLDHHDQ